MVFYYVAEKSALEKRVKELEETLATRNTEAEKSAKDVTVREEQFVNRVAFLAQNVQGKHSFSLFHALLSFSAQFSLLTCCLCFDSLQKQLAFQRRRTPRVTRCHSSKL